MAPLERVPPSEAPPNRSPDDLSTTDLGEAIDDDIIQNEGDAEAGVEADVDNADIEATQSRIDSTPGPTPDGDSGGDVASQGSAEVDTERARQTDEADVDEDSGGLGDTEDPEPSESDTEDPEPSEPDAEGPEPSEPDTEDPEPSEPDTVNPDPSEPDTADPDPSEPDTVNPEPPEPDTADPEPPEPDTADPGPSEPDTADPGRSESETSTPEGTSGAGPEVFFTIGRLPSFLNGSIDYVDDTGTAQEFVVRTPKSNTCLGIQAEPDSGPIDWPLTRLTCDATFTPQGGLPIPAGVFQPVGDFAQVDADGWMDICGALDLGDEEEPVQCLVEVNGPEGQTTESISFRAARLFPQNDPFLTEQTWMLMFSRDIWDHAVSAAGDGVALVTTYMPGGNGVADFDEALAAIGLIDLSAPEVASWVKGLIQERLRDYVQTCYDPRGDGGIRLTVVNEGAPNAPAIEDFIPGFRTDAGFSAIPIGGAAFPDDAIWGRCPGDSHNQKNENVMLGDNQGVMVTEMARQILLASGLTPYPTELMPFLGDPFGSLPDDVQVTTPGFDPSQDLDVIFQARLNHVLFGVNLIASFAGMVTCHEVGHSLGLVPVGAPPDGLFANVFGPAWIGSMTDHAHCEIGNNIMAAGLSLQDAFTLAETPKTFMPLVEAYLRRELIIGDPTLGSDLYMIYQGNVIGGATFLACWDSNHGHGCVQGGQQGVISLLDTPVSSEVVIRMSGPNLADTLHQIHTLSADAASKQGAHWLDLLRADDLAYAYMETATLPTEETAVVWPMFTHATSDTVAAGQADVRAELIGHDGAAWYQIDITGSEFARDEDIGPQVVRYGALFFDVAPGDYEMRITRKVDGDWVEQTCQPLSAWGQPSTGIIRVMTEADHVSRPTIVCL